MGGFHKYEIADVGLIVVLLPFAFAYFMEMQKELMKIQGGSKCRSMQWKYLSSDSPQHDRTFYNY